jgi:hypothetical protein
MQSGSLDYASQQAPTFLLVKWRQEEHCMTRKFLHLRYVVVLLLAIVIQISVLAPTAYGQAIDHSSLPQSAKAATCPTPPDGFDILHASLDEIHYYGLPRPPEGSTQERANWAKDFQEMHFTHRICGDGVVGTAAQPHHLLNKGNNEGYGGYRGNSIWEGYYASNGGFTRTIAKWYVPSYCCSNSKSNAGEWVGIGGVNSSSIWQAGTETDPEQGYRMWYEAFPNSIVYAGPAVSPGNQVYVNVDYNWTYSNESYVYMYNYANGQSYSAVTDLCMKG